MTCDAPTSVTLPGCCLQKPACMHPPPAARVAQAGARAGAGAAGDAAPLTRSRQSHTAGRGVSAYASHVRLCTRWNANGRPAAVDRGAGESGGARTAYARDRCIATAVTRAAHSARLTPGPSRTAASPARGWCLREQPHRSQFSGVCHSNNRGRGHSTGQWRAPRRCTRRPPSSVHVDTDCSVWYRRQCLKDLT